jgi:hypothetical protein
MLGGGGEVLKELSMFSFYVVGAFGVDYLSGKDM